MTVTGMFCFFFKKNVIVWVFCLYMCLCIACGPGTCVVLGIKPRALCMLGKRSAS